MFASALAIVGASGVAPAEASPGSARPAAASTDQASPLCQLEGGQSFAVDAGYGRQFPNDPLAYPFFMAGDILDISVIPCWVNDTAPAGTWIKSVTAYLGDDNTLVAQASGFHTVDRFTLTLNGKGPVPADASLAPLTIHATDNQGVVRSAKIMVQLIPPCTDDKMVSVDSGAAHKGTDVQIDGADAQLTVIPCSRDTSTPPTTWITSITATVGGGSVENMDHPAAELTGLHATDPFTIQLHNYDGTAYIPGVNQLYLDVTDNHGNEHTEFRQLWVVNPISATWSSSSTLPDTVTTVQADLDNESGSPIQSVTFAVDNGDGAGANTPAELAPDLSHASSAIHLTVGSNRIWALVTLANGIVYPLGGYEVYARYPVDTTVSAPDNTDWSDRTTFHAKAKSSSGPTPSGVTVHLQSRTPGSSAWVTRAVAKTDTRGAATLSVSAAKTGTAVWRVTSSQTKKQRPSTSRTHLVRVHADFGSLPGKRSVRAGHATRYKVAIKPANIRATVVAQVHRVGGTGWTTAGHAVTARTATVIPVWITRAGNYQVRLVVRATKAVVQTVSRRWDLHVTR